MTAPSQPRKLNARSQTHSEIVIEWEEPSRPNGEVTYYLVTGTRDPQELDLLNDRNYCTERKIYLSLFNTNWVLNQFLNKFFYDLNGIAITHDTPKKPIEEMPSLDNNCTQSHSPWLKNSTKESDSEECCSCKPTPVDDLEVERRITFEDHLINSIYIKKY